MKKDGDQLREQGEDVEEMAVENSCSSMDQGFGQDQQKVEEEEADEQDGEEVEGEEKLLLPLADASYNQRQEVFFRCFFIGF
jgi:hypothetical protein